ncbi:MAG: GH3 auxin-responsive promoter family protein [Candidatus Omnitrophota bacterium]
MNIIYYALKILVPKVRAFEEATKDPIEAQKKALLEYITRNKDTLYGQKYNFAGIESIEDFQRMVPMSDYESLEPYIEKMKKGESNILTVDEPILFGVTSGTTGRQKFVPITNYSRTKKADVMDLWIYYISKDHPDVFDGKILAIVSPEVEGHTESGVPYGTETGHGYKNLPDVVRALYVLPYEVFEIKDYESKYYSILRLAMEENVTTIATMNPSTIVLLCQKIEKIKDDVIEDIEKGTLKGDLDIPNNIREIIEKRLKPNPERAEELRKILKKKKKLLPKDIWPNMKLIECWKGGTVGVYLREFPKYFGDVSVRDFGYLASELRGSIPVSDAGAGGVLAINANFYEFIPKEDMGAREKRVLLCDQLEKHKEYFIMVTTPGGLCRYNIDDIIRVIGYFNNTPIIEFVQKGLNVSSITGEKLYESQVVEAVHKAVERHKLPLKFFTACVQTRGNFCYNFLVEFGEALPHNIKKEFLKSIDEELCRANVEYESKRKSQRLCHPVLKVVKPGEFEKYREKKVNEGAHDGQFKVSELSCDLDFYKQFKIEEDISIE